MWSKVVHDKGPVLCHRAALICAVVAYVGLLAPKSHSAAQLPAKASTNHRLQIENARRLLETYYQYYEEEENQSEQQQFNGMEQWDQDQRKGEFERALRQLEAETLYCYYSASAGLRKRTFCSVGRAIRLGKSLGLFEEGGWKGREQDQELRRGIAWDLIIVDR